MGFFTACRLKSTLRRYIGRTPTPVLVPAKQGPLHLSILYIVAYGAGFAGLLLGRAWRLEHMQAGEKLKLGNVIPSLSSQSVATSCTI